jgi:hypothetical protein
VTVTEYVDECDDRFLLAWGFCAWWNDYIDNVRCFVRSFERSGEVVIDRAVLFQQMARGNIKDHCSSFLVVFFPTRVSSIGTCHLLFRSFLYNYPPNKIIRYTSMPYQVSVRKCQASSMITRLCHHRWNT